MNHENIIQLCKTVFENVSSQTQGWLLPLFLIRVVYGSISGNGEEEVKSALKGVLIYFVLVSGFEFVLNAIFTLQETYLPSFEYKATAVGAEPQSSSWLNLPEKIEYMGELIMATLYHAAYWFYAIFMVVCSSMGPIIFLLSGLLNIGIGINIFFGLILMGGSWPIMWNAFDKALEVLSQNQEMGFGKMCLEIMVQVLKAVGPLALAFSSMNSGPGKGLSSLAKGAIESGEGILGKGLGMMRTRSTAGTRSAASSAGDLIHNPSQTSNKEMHSMGVVSQHQRSPNTVKSGLQKSGKILSQLNGFTKNKNQRNQNLDEGQVKKNLGNFDGKSSYKNSSKQNQTHGSDVLNHQTNGNPTYGNHSFVESNKEKSYPEVGDRLQGQQNLRLDNQVSEVNHESSPNHSLQKKSQEFGNHSESYLQIPKYEKKQNQAFSANENLKNNPLPDLTSEKATKNLPKKQISKNQRKISTQGNSMSYLGDTSFYDNPSTYSMILQGSTKHRKAKL